MTLRRVPLKRNTPLRARRYWASTPKLDGPRARRRKVTDPTPEQRAEVMARTRGLCAYTWVGSFTGERWRCRQQAAHVHHRKLRKQGGTNTLENLVPLCLRCHNVIHEHPETSYAEGWLIHAWDAVTPWPERWFR